jgi:polar amino acid transport system substrate-binding protein
MRPVLRAPRRKIRPATAVILGAALTAISIAVSAQAPELALVSTAWPPFTNAPGQPRFALDLVETALDRVGVTTKTTIVSAAEFTAALLSGQFDGSAAVWKDPERERLLIFSEPYLENRLVLVGRHGADVSAGSLSNLKGKRVAIVEGYSYGEAVDTTGPTFVRSHSDEDSLARLLDGSVDYMLVDELVVQYIVRNYPKESSAKLEIGTTPLIARQLYFAVRRSRPDAASIVDRFNAQLVGMIADRTYHRLLHLDWIRADVNGDGKTEYVPFDDRLGSSQPRHAYTLFSIPVAGPRTPDKPGFYVGGNIYADWASVPESYKEVNPQPPDARRSTATIFTFVW